MNDQVASAYTAIEVADMLLTISDIQQILHTTPFDENTARQKICEINEKHPDNITVWNLLHTNISSGISVEQASKENLYEDLQWKEYYLQAKTIGKSVDEMRKDLLKL